jgi:hypothetical protein
MWIAGEQSGAALYSGSRGKKRPKAAIPLRWLPDHSGRWFYERARGSYGAAELRASFRAAEKRRFASETPKGRRFSKTDMAKYLNAWEGLPNLVSFGNQKNFQSFMQGMKENYP